MTTTQVLTALGQTVHELRGGVATGPLGAWLGGVAFYPGTADILVTDMKHHRVLAWSLWDESSSGRGTDDGPLSTTRRACSINDQARVLCGRRASPMSTGGNVAERDTISDPHATGQSGAADHVVTALSAQASAGAGLDTPMGIAVDPTTGAVWVVDKGNDRICVFR